MIKIKVLIISHNPFSTYQSMGKTFISLFSAFEKEELCQLYIYPSFPDIDAVNSCYRITDRDAIKKIVPWWRAGGKVFMHEYKESMIENKIDGILYAKKSNNSSAQRIARDIVWKLSSWYSRDLRTWLKEENPDCIFLAPGYASFIYDIALKIAKKKKIPIITYICDDYYFSYNAKTRLDRYHRVLLRKKTRQILAKSQAMIAISEEIKNQYTKEFLIDCEVIMTGASIRVSDTLADQRQIRSLSYFGNIGLNRDKSLAEIGQVLDEINSEHGTNYQLKIYTQEDKISAFQGIQSIYMCGFLTGKAFFEAFSRSDCLVHVESFDQETVALVKGSISTKIADSLASGIPMLVYAPSGIASVEHLRRNDCAFIANQNTCLKTVICKILNDKEMRKHVSQNAVHTANRYHISNNNSIHLKSLIEKVVGE